jgi:GcrA cell cycle regulator
MLKTLNRPNLWTGERIDLLRQLWTDGLSCSRIAAKLDCGLSRNAVIGKVSRLKLPGRKTVACKARSYRSGPASYEEKSRREAERTAKRMLAKLERRQRKVDGSLPPLNIIEPPAPAEFLNLTFDQLVRDSCRYPRGEGADMRFCGQPKMAGQSYCLHCYAITHNKPHDSTPKARTHWVDFLARRAA